mmetsp:Transcript_7071/g.20634  ORF Transcript_7071/g.20634 Transcript_7071/m.20634 type:complete len:204 (-) Transcript_7071:1353-1964(-)
MLKISSKVSKTSSTIFSFVTLSSEPALETNSSTKESYLLLLAALKFFICWTMSDLWESRFSITLSSTRVGSNTTIPSSCSTYILQLVTSTLGRALTIVKVSFTPLSPRSLSNANSNRDLRSESLSLSISSKVFTLIPPGVPFAIIFMTCSSTWGSWYNPDLPCRALLLFEVTLWVLGLLTSVGTAWKMHCIVSITAWVGANQQ